MTKSIMFKLAIALGMIMICAGCLPQPPTFAPEPGSYYESQTVTISNPDGAEVCYTTDGSEPTHGDTCFVTETDTVEFDKSTLIKAIAYDGDNGSVVVAAYYAIEALVAETGQTSCYDVAGAEIDCAGTGQDGEWQAGVQWPDPRFTDNLDGTVTDNLTRLIWLQNANCFGKRTWAEALSDSNSLADGSCGLTDDSSAGDWRLSNLKELESLLDMSNFYPTLPTDHPFAAVQSNFYWSSTTDPDVTYEAWRVSVDFGDVGHYSKSYNGYYVWPVRGPE